VGIFSLKLFVYYEVGGRGSGKYRKFLESTTVLLLKNETIFIAARDEEHGFDVYSDLKAMGLEKLTFKHAYRKEPMYSKEPDFKYIEKYAGTRVWLVK
jgi:hypothetical protein